jgi:mono/diheme cytochrome c family protein
LSILQVSWRRRTGLQVCCATLFAAAFAAALLAPLTAVPQAQTSRSVNDNDGVYTNAQAARGQALYAKQCAACHGDLLKGAQGPPLVEQPFLIRWSNQPLSALAGKIRHTMPPGAPGTLTREQTVDLVAHVLRTGGFPAGRTELAAGDEPLGRIGWAGLAPGSGGNTGGGQARVYPPLGNMAQLMRGIFFPNSNLIFTVQTHDPAAPAPKRPATDPSAGFSWVDWGNGIYGGWELVDNAAIALADASPLMLAPGIRCENGRTAPVTDAAWIKYTEEMIAVARQLYKLSQTKNQEAVSDATGDLADACANCHRAYRDVGRPGRGLDPNDPSNKAGRCVSRSSQ